jgi:hypothetical protein
MVPFAVCTSAAAAAAALGDCLCEGVGWFRFGGESDRVF